MASLIFVTSRIIYRLPPMPPTPRHRMLDEFGGGAEKGPNLCPLNLKSNWNLELGESMKNWDWDPGAQSDNLETLIEE